MESDRDLGLLLVTACNAYIDALHDRLGAERHTVLRPVDGYLFRVLHDQGHATVTEIGDLLGVTKQAASQAVQSLVERGYVVVEADGADGRRRIVRLSAKGESVRTMAIGIADAIEDEIVARVGPRSVAGMRRALDALIEVDADQQSALVRRLAQIGRERDPDRS